VVKVLKEIFTVGFKEKFQFSAHFQNIILSLTEIFSFVPSNIKQVKSMITRTSLDIFDFIKDIISLSYNEQN
jgi:hypothetical protein